MIYTLIRSLMNGAAARDVVPGMIFTVIVVLFSLSLHEASHGWMASKLGDKTALYTGRLTLDPRKHLDPIGTVCMLLFGFGWAKPVPVNSRYFKKPRRDMALTALAGPVSNLLLAFVSLLVFSIITAFNKTAAAFFYYGFAGDIIMSASFGGKALALLGQLFYYSHILNLYLALFNLVPIPPLDGSRIALIFLPDRVYFGIMKYERYISIALFVLLWSGFFSNILSTACGYVSLGMSYLIHLIPGL